MAADRNHFGIFETQNVFDKTTNIGISRPALLPSSNNSGKVVIQQYGIAGFTDIRSRNPHRNSNIRLFSALAHHSPCHPSWQQRIFGFCKAWTIEFVFGGRRGVNADFSTISSRS
jgi:hypothetical protein